MGSIGELLTNVVSIFIWIFLYIHVLWILVIEFDNILGHSGPDFV